MLSLDAIEPYFSLTYFSSQIVPITTLITKAINPKRKLKQIIPKTATTDAASTTPTNPTVKTTILCARSAKEFILSFISVILFLGITIIAPQLEPT